MNDYLLTLFGGVLIGFFIELLRQKVLNKRGVFSYFVSHNIVGISTQDLIFGTVSVTWNGNSIDNLYLSTLDLKNDSLNDYENVVIRIYTDDTRILSESTQIIGTPNTLEWTENYSVQLPVEPDAILTDEQISIYNFQREYVIPVFNRGQEIRINYLNSALSPEVPNISLAAIHKGVKVKCRPPQNQIFGEPHLLATLMGTIIGFIFWIIAVLFTENIWIWWAVALIMLAYGILVVAPGAYAIKLCRKIREIIGD